MPLIKVYADMHGEKSTDLIGRVARMKMHIEGNELGQAEIFVDNKFLLVKVIARNQEEMNQGQKVLIVDYNSQRDIYVVEKDHS